MAYTYEEAKNYINDIPRFTSKNEPEKTGAFLEFLGDVSMDIPTVHVAGTNGKGSVCAFIDSVMKEAGYKCAMFTSPHLVSIRERFIYDGQIISREDFAEFFNLLMDKLEDYNALNKTDFHPTFFEFLFFMGVLYFQKKKPDLLILETGLGGRLDATNSIKSPRACVITEIGYDHMEYLGDTLEKIAGEKAGIIKAGVPLIYIDKPKSGQVIADRALALKAPSWAIASNSYKIINYGVGGIDFLLASRYHKNVNLKVACLAPYQVENASLAYRTLEVLRDDYEDFKITDQALCAGIRNMKWPGRMEGVLDNFFIDGAHNEDGINAFLDAVAAMKCKKASLLYSAVSDKQVELITKKIIESGLFDRYYVAVLDSYRAADIERLKLSFAGARDKAEFFHSVKEAMETMLHDADNDTMCFSAGSLYLVGEIKRIIDDKL